jgi:uncharacterized membrane protein YgaE (UPF0421/DUF939 family)
MKKFIAKHQPEFTFNVHSFVNSLKTVLACLIGLALSQLLQLDQPQWMLITILIVMASQYRLGGALLKGYARLFATILGTILASTILFLFSENLILVYFCLFSLIIVFIYLASNSKEHSYAYTLGAVTLVIIIVSSKPQFHYALDRALEILLGVITAFLVSRFVLPIKSEKLLYENMFVTLGYLKQAYKLFITEQKAFSIETKDKNLEEEIINQFANQPILIREACAESPRFKKNYYKYVIFLRLQRRLLRSIYMLHYTLRTSLKDFRQILKMQEFKLLHQEIIETIDDIAKKIKNKRYVMPHQNLKADYEKIISPLRQELPKYSFEDKIKIYAFIFCLGHVITILNRMEKFL